MSKNDAKNVMSAKRFCDIKKKDFFQRGALHRKSVSFWKSYFNIYKTSMYVVFI
jgi:hypothetical protein